MTPTELSAAWRDRAVLMEKYGAAEIATTLRACADEMEATIAEAESEPLTLREAAEECGYSERRLRELITDGTIPQAGRKGMPRIRRGDLPRRARRPAAAGDYDPEQDARELVARLHGGSA